MADHLPAKQEGGLPDESRQPRRADIKPPTRWQVYRDRWPSYAFNLGSLVVGFLGVGGLSSHLVDLTTKPLGWVTIVCGTIGTVGLVRLGFQDPTLSELRFSRDAAVADLAKQVERSSHLAESARSTFRSAMSALAADLALGDDGRITICRVPDTGPYRVVGRFAAHADHDEVKNVEYARGAGCIHSALGTSHLVCREIHADPKVQREQWLAEQVSLGISRDTAEKLRMGSRSYASLRLRDDKRAVGVIVCESLRGGQFADVANTESVIRRHAPTLTTFVVEAEVHGDYLNAWQRGF